MATRRRTSTGTRRRTTSSRRRTTRRTGYAPRRRRKGTAASFGSAFGLLLVWVLVSAPWWVKILAVVVALAAGIGYVLVTRGGDAPDAGPDAAPDAPPQNPAPPSEGTPA